MLNLLKMYLTIISTFIVLALIYLKNVNPNIAKILKNKFFQYFIGTLLLILLTYKLIIFENKWTSYVQVSILIIVLIIGVLQLIRRNKI